MEEFHSSEYRRLVHCLNSKVRVNTVEVHLIIRLTDSENHLLRTGEELAIIFGC